MTANPGTVILRQMDVARLSVAMYDPHVLSAVLHLLLGTSALWFVYLYKGREETGIGGFVLWFPFLLVATIGTGIVARHAFEGLAVVLPDTVYVFPVAFIVALASRPVFRMSLRYLTVHALTALGVVAVVAWLLHVAIDPVLQRY